MQERSLSDAGESNDQTMNAPIMQHKHLLNGMRLLIATTCMLYSDAMAQIHFLHANGMMVVRNSIQQDQGGITDTESKFDASPLTIALDYERLIVTVSHANGAPSHYAITRITNQMDGLECDFVDEKTEVVYSLRLTHLEIMKGKPVLGISWNDGKDGNEIFELWSEDVKLY